MLSPFYKALYDILGHSCITPPIYMFSGVDTEDTTQPVVGSFNVREQLKHASSQEAPGCLWWLFLVVSGPPLESIENKCLSTPNVRYFLYWIIWSNKTHPMSGLHLLMAGQKKGHGRRKLWGFACLFSWLASSFILLRRHSFAAVRTCLFRVPMQTED